MLVLNRKLGQSITIGEDIEIKFLKVHRKDNIRNERITQSVPMCQFNEIDISLLCYQGYNKNVS